MNRPEKDKIHSENTITISGDAISTTPRVFILRKAVPQATSFNTPIVEFL